MILSPTLKPRGPPDGGGYVANPPTCGPLLTFSLALKRWEPPGLEALCSQSTHLWTIADFVPGSKVLETPQTAGLWSQSTHLWATAHFAPRFEVWRTSQTAEVV